MNKKQKITIHDVALHVGVSKATISRFLNGRYEYMSGETRDRIEKAVSELGFRPNRIAKSLKTDRSNLVGLVLANANSTLTPFLVSGVCDICAKHGRSLIVINSNDNEERELEQVNNLLDHHIDGLIISSGYNIDFYEKLDKTDLPVVLLDRVSKKSTLDSVTINHKKATSSVIDHLIDRNFEQIVLLTSNSSPLSTIHLRETAVIKTCHKRFGDANHVKKILIPEESDKELQQILMDCYYSSNKHKIAVFVANAKMMIRVINNYYQLELKINDNFTIAGYDIWNISHTITPRISSIVQPLEQMAQQAAEQLIARISSGEPEENRKPYKKVLQCTCTYA